MPAFYHGSMLVVWPHRLHCIATGEPKHASVSLFAHQRHSRVCVVLHILPLEPSNEHVPGHFCSSSKTAFIERSNNKDELKISKERFIGTSVIQYNPRLHTQRVGSFFSSTTPRRRRHFLHLSHSTQVALLEPVVCPKMEPPSRSS